MVSTLLGKKSFYIVLSLVLILIIVFLFIKHSNNKDSDLITAQVTRGNIEHIVSVSGIVEADNTAELAFPVSGRIAEVNVSEGDVVEKGQLIASLEKKSLEAERKNAQASLVIARADLDELLNGPSGEERRVTDTTVKIAEENLVRVTAAENEKVLNAKRTLLSSSLEALPVKSTNDETPPTVSGTYTCEEGEYKLSIYSSGSSSGDSFNLSGLEDGTYTAYTGSSAPIGECGLSIQFDENESYSNSDWIIQIPNKRSSSYATNLNAYNLALQLQQNNVTEAEQELELALNKQLLENTTPRDEALQRANANVLKAEANLAVIEANIQDRTLVAPFAGSITNIDILPGEIVGTEPIATVLAEDLFEITARIPEIDITKINVGQTTNIVFDARVDEVINSQIVFVSPLATEIDGVAYFEAKIGMENPPFWLRSGLNSDIDIIVESRSDVLRIPKRFLIREGDQTTVLLLKNNEVRETPVWVGFIGNDGFVEITGINEGDTVVAPETDEVS